MEKGKVKSTKKTTKVSKTKLENDRVKKDDSVFEKETENKFYYSFGKRLTINIILLIVFIGLFIFSFVMSFAITKKEFIKYKERSNIDYKIHLKDNTFYEDEYIGKGMVYVASLIDKIHIDYNYYFNVDKKSNLDIKYKVKAKLVIGSQQNSNVFFTKEYDLTKQVLDEMINENEYVINKKDIVIDYNYYNNLANDFKSKYAVNTDSKLEVSLEVSENSKKDNSYDFSNNNRVTLVIPLSQQEVNITFDNKNIDLENQIINNPKFIIKDIGYTLLTIVLFILFVITLVSLLKKIMMVSGNKNSNYDKYVKRLLKGYDRIIINVKTTPKFEDYNVIKVDSFQELIDVRDNTSEPINYYVITPHQKCEFFVVNKDNLYLYIVKSADLDGETINGKEKTK